MHTRCTATCRLPPPTAITASSLPVRLQAILRAPPPLNADVLKAPALCLIGGASILFGYNHLLRCSIFVRTHVCAAPRAWQLTTMSIGEHEHSPAVDYSSRCNSKSGCSAPSAKYGQEHGYLTGNLPSTWACLVATYEAPLRLY